MDHTSNRTFVCSVLFLDIVEYTKKSVTEQMKLKQRFNALLIRAMEYVATSDRIVLDTGDGAAVCFLGSPEVAMFVAMDLRDGITGESPDETTPLLVRMGANLGPIRLIKDINGQVNIIGDGVNVAQRVMSFAEANTILVSRSFHEVVSRLSDDYATILSYEGSRTDKHVREHEVYVVGPNIPHKYALQSATLAPGAPETAVEVPATTNGSAVSVSETPPVHAEGISRMQLAVVSAMAIAILAGGVILRLERNDSRVESSTPPVAHAGPSKQTLPPALPAAPPTISTVAPPSKAESAAPQPVIERPAPRVVADAPKSTPPEKVASSEKAIVALVIIPWGEVYIDGLKRGISPPIKTLFVTPGKHTVEIKNSSLPVYQEKIDVKAGAQIKIKHKF